MNITQDLVDEILSRLPVKFLARFNLVCKDWYANIHSHSLIAKHIKNQPTNEKLMIFKIGSYSRNHTVSILSDQEEEGDDRRIHMPSDQLEYYLVEIIASCNGLVCFRYNTLCDHEIISIKSLKSITLWNPATRDFKTLPPVPGAITSGVLVGFGYDRAPNDYKVVQISQLLKEDCPHRESKPDVIQMKIYSLSSNSWRDFDCSDLSTEIITPQKSRGTIFLKEKFCWLAGDSSGKEGMILSFDMGKEVFLKTPLPLDYVALEGKTYVTELFQLNDSIALVHYEERDTEMTFSIWTIKKLEQEGNSWIKLANVGPLSRIGWALGFWKCKNRNDFLFLIDGNWNDKHGWALGFKYVYMNNRDQVENDRWMTMKVKSTIIGVPIKVLTYVETLVSVNRDHN